MKRLPYYIVMLLLPLVAFSACARERAYREAPEYIPLPNGEFPIMASYAFYDDYMTDRQFALVREAGFNIINKRHGYPGLDTCLKYAAKHGLYVMIAPWNMSKLEAVEETVARYKDNPAAWGYNIADEPNADQFDNLAAIVAKLEQLDPGKNSFINLFPDAGKKHLHAPDYRDYVERYVETVNPPFISFDHYPVRYDKKRGIYVDDGFYKTIGIVADVARESGRPFWSYVLSVKHFIYPKPEEAHIRFQVFAALAYGARGLSYFTYILPDFDKGKGEFTDAPIDLQGNPTDVWEMVRNVNEEVQNLRGIFLGSETPTVKLTGKSIPPAAEKMQSPPEGFVKLEGEKSGLIVSEFTNGDQRFVMVLNRDVQKGQKVKFSTRDRFTIIDNSGKEIPIKSNLSILKPGGYIIFKGAASR